LTHKLLPRNRLDGTVLINNVDSLGALKMVRVFLADHHSLIRGGLRTLLRARSDFSICGEADNGIEAVKLAIQAKPNVVVMNVNLPDINGIEATRQIRKALPDTEILIFTAENNEDIMRESLKAGARGYLLKMAASDDQIIVAIETVAQHRGYYSGFLAEKLLRSGHDGSQLTMREREILHLIAEGRRSREIAQMLGISLRTVETHRAAGMRKLHLHSIADVVHYAMRGRPIQM
jgi:DNA-binding NarL/FixJ family response regulator